VKKCASKLVTIYPADIEESFVSKFLQFIALIREGDTVTSVAHMNGLLRAHGGILLSIFPNVGFALRLYLPLPVINCKGEKSFSTLARIKNHLRAPMGQARLSALSLMCIESELMRSVDFDDVNVLNDFAAGKSRRRDF